MLEETAPSVLVLWEERQNLCKTCKCYLKYTTGSYSRWLQPLCKVSDMHLSKAYLQYVGASIKWRSGNGATTARATARALPPRKLLNL